jgi:hypothetical protein
MKEQARESEAKGSGNVVLQLQAHLSEDDPEVTVFQPELERDDTYNVDVCFQLAMTNPTSLAKYPNIKS